MSRLIDLLFLKSNCADGRNCNVPKLSCISLLISILFPKLVAVVVLDFYAFLVSV